METCEQLTDVDAIAAVMALAQPDSAAPSDENEEGHSTLLDLPGCIRAMEALDTLQPYQLGVSNSENAQMSLEGLEYRLYCILNE